MPALQPELLPGLAQGGFSDRISASVRLGSPSAATSGRTKSGRRLPKTTCSSWWTRPSKQPLDVMFEGKPGAALAGLGRAQEQLIKFAGVADQCCNWIVCLLHQAGGLRGSLAQFQLSL